MVPEYLERDGDIYNDMDDYNIDDDDDDDDDGDDNDDYDEWWWRRRWWLQWLNELIVC